MRTSITIDDAAFEEASDLTGIRDKNKLINEALGALIARERAKHLINLGGIEPDAEDIPRRRSPTPSPPVK